MAKTINDLIDGAKADSATKADHRHNDNPWVLVTRRSFAFEMPGGSFGVTAKNKDGAILPVTVSTQIGATFLCAMVPCFGLLEFPLHAAPPVEFPSQRVGATCTFHSPHPFGGSPFIDANGKRDFAFTEAALVDGLRSIGALDRGAAYDARQVQRSRFLVAPGLAGPDAMLMRVRDIFDPTPEANMAQGILRDVMKWSKTQTHAGALHDYAIACGPLGNSIAQECRRRANATGWKRLG